MEKIDEEIEEHEIRSVRDEEAHVEQERLVVLPEVLPHDSHDSHASHGWLAGSHGSLARTLSRPFSNLFQGLHRLQISVQLAQKLILPV